MAILLVEQYFDFARDLAHDFASWTAARSCSPAGRDDLDEADVQRWLTV